FRQRGRWNSKERGQLGGPSPPLDVVEERPACVGGIRRVDAAAGELPEEPRVDGPEGQISPIGFGAGAGDVIEKPFQLRRRKIGIEAEPRLPRDRALVAGPPQSLASGRGAAVLPDDRGRDGPRCGSLPEERRFALVRDSDRG